MFAYICGESGTVVSAFHTLWLTRRVPVTRGESDRGIDDVNKTIIVGAPIAPFAPRSLAATAVIPLEPAATMVVPGARALPNVRSF